MKFLVTGSAGFLGRNLLVALRRVKGLEIFEFDREHDPDLLNTLLAETDFVYHLAGSNRPTVETEFQEVNVDLTRTVCEQLARRDKQVPVVLSSSIQAELDNPYGISKKGAERVVFDYTSRTGAPVYVYRLSNLFGKWGQPNYNSVVTTFCYNTARDIQIRIDNPASLIRLNYVDDVVTAFVNLIDGVVPATEDLLEIKPCYEITVGALKERLESYRRVRSDLLLPDMNDPLNKVLYPTYLSYLPSDQFSGSVDLRTDDRGWLFELLKSPHFGQIFVSTTHPGITRGNHYHDTKIEKFCVVSGQAMIRFRHLDSDELIEYPVSGDKPEIVDIPPGYTHSIENTGDTEMLCLFWAGEIFNQERPDTYFSKVVSDK